jgi:hypothetical protein
MLFIIFEFQHAQIQVYAYLQSIKKDFILIRLEYYFRIEQAKKN